MGDKPYPWTPEIEDEIFRRIGDGESLVAICADDWLPSRETVRKRIRDDAAFAVRYARAREVQADTLFDEILTIADKATSEDAHARRLMIDARKWMAGKLRPKVYGDRIEVSGDPERPVVTKIEWTIVKPDD